FREESPYRHIMPRSDFIDQLKKLGYEEVSEKNSFVSFDYIVEVGKFAGQKIKMAFQVTDDFPLNPPGGPHISPRLLPLHTNQDPHPNGGIHASDNLGSDWEYWSRPFKDSWNQTDRTVRTYMAFIRRLFEDQ
ncbi:MAG: E2/UBC family protein, partial [Nitrosotalea sp.]